MSCPGFKRLEHRRGFFLIGLLIVIVIMLILAKNQMGNRGENVKRPISLSKDVACSMNRSAFLTNLSMWRMNHPGEKPTWENLRRDNVQIPSCPEGGKWILSPDGQTVYCTLHAPPPTPVPRPRNQP